jgi:hypothetical protein
MSHQAWNVRLKNGVNVRVKLPKTRNLREEHHLLSTVNPYKKKRWVLREQLHVLVTDVEGITKE